MGAQHMFYLGVIKECHNSIVTSLLIMNYELFAMGAGPPYISVWFMRYMYYPLKGGGVMSPSSLIVACFWHMYQTYFHHRTEPWTFTCMQCCITLAGPMFYIDCAGDKPTVLVLCTMINFSSHLQ